MSCRYKAIKVKGVKHDLHRYLMEQQIGRALTRNEVVHHKNGDKQDNRIENLEVMTLAEHTRLHAKGRKPTLAQRELLHRRNFNKPNFAQRLLTKREAEEIKELLSIGFSECQLACNYGVSRGTIQNIRHNRSKFLE